MTVRRITIPVAVRSAHEAYPAARAIARELGVEVVSDGALTRAGLSTYNVELVVRPAMARPATVRIAPRPEWDGP